MLDDLKIIHERDKSDALGVAEKQPAQLLQTFDVTVQSADEIRNIVVAGMGGSGWPALYLNTWPKLNIPFEVVSNYSLPGYVGRNTLVIASSFSGNTEETLASLTEAEQKGAQIVVMTSGGQLAERARSAGHPLYLLPSGTQPRMSTFYFLAAYINLFEQLGFIGASATQELREVSAWLVGQIGSWTATVPASQNLAKQLAQDMLGKSVVIYGGAQTGPVARKWKICINENAKHVAWWNQFPEFNHNEFMGWSAQPVDKPYCVVDLRSNLEHERIQKRFEVTERMLSGRRPAAHVVDVQGDTPLQQLLWTSVLGDFTSIYLAILNNIDPTPVDLIEKFKEELNK